MKNIFVQNRVQHVATVAGKLFYGKLKANLKYRPNCQLLSYNSYIILKWFDFTVAPSTAIKNNDSGDAFNASNLTLSIK